MTFTLGAREARQRFAELLGRVGFAKEIAIVERSGKPMAALIPVDLYERLVADREARFQVLDRIRERLPEIASEEIQADVERAISELRAENAAGGS